MLSATCAASASASPVWKFNGSELTGSETLLSHATEGSFTIPGLTTRCNPFVYVMTIRNEAGTGKGTMMEVSLSNCSTDSAVCTVDAIGAEKLPWAAHLATKAGANYLIIEGFKLSILYGGPECVLGGILMTITGSAGGLIDNEAESVTFNAASFKATGTALKAFGNAIQWNGVFTMIATGAHIGQALTVS